MSTRAEEYQDVRRALGFPLPGAPSADLIISQLLRQEQLMLNKLNGTGKAWATATAEVTTIAGQDAYVVTPVAGSTHGFGKPLFVYRDLGNGDIIPVPYADYSHELHSQGHEFWGLPWGADTTAHYQSMKVAFYRTADNASTQMIRVYPVPDKADVGYKIVYAAGAIDADEIQLSDIPVMPEWSNVRTLEAAMYLLPYTKWEGLLAVDNSNRRKEIATSLMAQVADHREEFQGYISNPQHEPLADSGYWWEN